ncbi:7-carboxy-7-deazaguanine synthase QueE [Chitinibacteraceae bacterium HSL-7]
MRALRISEIFCSLQGETSRTGLPTVFVRLTGCPLRCTWCDSAYAFTGGTTRELDDIVAEVASHGTRYVCVTGGEPLAQKGVHALLTRLCDEGFSVSLETSGAMPIHDVDPRVARIVDVKAPGSGEVDKNHWANLDDLRAGDEVKFVLASRDDFDWACEVIRRLDLDTRAPLLFSPVWDSLPPADLAQWILTSRLNVRMQLQLHKVLWGEKPGV